ncbi:MAG: hypothetical protein IPJ84_19665 [Bdellovibrionales bacterium]|nr:hypothetical protein [Bdellovibrionales bacterium]
MNWKLVPLVLFFALLTSGQSASAYVLVTDVDDTIKVTHVRDVVDRTVRFFTEPQSFAGMDLLYKRMLNSQPHGEFAVVSGAPRAVQMAVQWFLVAFGFPAPSYLQTREMFEDTALFKIKAISNLFRFNERDGAVVVMVGDDTEQDPFVYDNVSKNYYIEPTVYIRRVSNRGIGAGAQYFDSAADIAVLEFLAGRLEPQDVYDVYKSILSEAELPRLFVPGEYCPGDSSPRLSSTVPRTFLEPAMIKGLIDVENHLRRACRGTAEWFRLQVEISAPRPLRSAE